MTSVNYESIEQALGQIRKFFPPTPLLFSALFSEFCSKPVHIKWDNTLRTGSFKERGAICALSNLSEEQKKLGIIAASAGNHAQALSYYAKNFNVECEIIMPKWASLVKVTKTKKYGANVVLYGNTFQEAYDYAIDKSKTTGKIFISAFDNDHIINGQGSLGIELLDQSSDFDSVIVPIGGGGLISGIATAIKNRRPHIKIIGVQSEWIVQNRTHGHTTSLLAPSTIADGIAVKNIGVKNKVIIDQLVDEIVTVSEEQVASAIVRLLEFERTIVEGAGAASIAALMHNLISTKIQKPIAVVCGSNIDLDVVYRLLMRDLSKQGRHIRIKTSVPDKPGSLQVLTKIFAEEGANIIDVDHDRAFAAIPGDVEIRFSLEVRDKEHKSKILEKLTELKISFSLSD
jgi:threonine dehydratase